MKRNTDKMLATAFVSICVLLSCESAAAAVRAGRIKSSPMQAVVAPAGKVSIGTNLGEFNYYSSAIPFKDVAMQSTGVQLLPSAAQCPTALDTQGYPLSLPVGCTASLWMLGHIAQPVGAPRYKTGRYILTYDGIGKVAVSGDGVVVSTSPGRVEFNVSNATSAGITARIVESDASNYVRNIHVLHQDDYGTFDVNNPFQGSNQPFNPTWLNVIKPFKTIRFMDWGKVVEADTLITGQKAMVSATDYSIVLPPDAKEADGDGLSTVDNAYVGDLATVRVPTGTDANGAIKYTYYRFFVKSYDADTRTFTLYSKTAPTYLLGTTSFQPLFGLTRQRVRKWSERTQPLTLGQSRGKGVSYEAMIHAANVANANPWFSIPTGVDDDFVWQLARLIKARLKPGLVPHIEYSNELWNYGFSAFGYSEAKMRELGPTGAKFTTPSEFWTAHRSVKIFKIFNRVYGEPDLRSARTTSRLVRVLSTQAAWPARGKSMVNYNGAGEPLYGIAAGDYADALAIAPYFDKGKNADGTSIDIMTASSQEIVTNLKYQMDKAYNPAIDEAKGIGAVYNYAYFAKAKGLKLLAYENGQHMLPSSDPLIQAAMNDKLASFNMSSGMGEAYGYMLAKMSKLDSDFPGMLGTWNQYVDIGGYSKYGYWGLLTGVYQNPLTSPKYQALSNYIYQSQ